MGGTYVLVLLSWLGGYVSGYSITTVEFASRDACEAAASEVRRTWDGKSDGLKMHCVATGRQR